MNSVIRYTSTTSNRNNVAAIHRVAATIRDTVESLGLDNMPNVTVAANGSWLENDTTGEDD